MSPSLTRPDWLKEAPRNPRLLWLDKNENTDPELASLVVSILSKLDSRLLLTYPEMGGLYCKLAEIERRLPNQLLFAAGSDGVIRTVFESFIREGDVVLHTTPTFAMYPVYCMIFGAKAVTLDYEPSDQGPILKFERISMALEEIRPRLFCLPNPDSPTGTVFNPAQIEALVEQCARVGTMILIDEAYYPFYQHTAASLVERFQNLIVARTFSKAWGLAGLRTGFAISHQETTRILSKVRPMYELNTVAVGFIDKMLEHEADMRRSVERLNAGKAFFNSEMKGLGFRTLNNHGNFTHVAFGGVQNQVFAALEDLVLFRKDFKDPGLRGFSRFTAGTRETLLPLIERIRSVSQQGVRHG